MLGEPTVEHAVEPMRLLEIALFRVVPMMLVWGASRPLVSQAGRQRAREKTTADRLAEIVGKAIELFNRALPNQLSLGSRRQIYGARDGIEEGDRR